jgi:lysozyme
MNLATKLQQITGKVPLIFGNKYDLNGVLDHDFDRFMVWLKAYDSQGDPASTGLRLKGANPWTLWQYTGSLQIDGIRIDKVRNKLTGNLFFGTASQFELFRAGETNVGRSESLRAARVIRYPLPNQ